jgi:bile acid:Na+ symporter, BASS family
MCILRCMKSQIEKHPALVFTSALLVGVFLPIQTPWQSSLLKFLMGVLLFLSYLNVDFSYIKKKVRSPLQLILDIGLNFLLVPVVLFFVLRALGLPEFALATLLLAAMPAGLGSPVFTTMAGGRIETSVLLSVCTHLLTPLTVPLLFWLAAGIDVQINVLAMAKQLGLLVFLPLALAILARNVVPAVTAATKPYRKLTSILALAAVAYLAITPYANTIRNETIAVLLPVIGLYALYAVLCLSAFALSMRRVSDERIGLMVSRIYMNNALAIVLAQSFFGERITLLMILAEIPWFTTFGAYLWFQKHALKQSSIS